MHDKSGSIFKNIDDKFVQLFKEVNSINENINLFRSLIKELTDKYQDVDLLKSLDSKFELSVKTYQNFYESLKSQKDVLKIEVDLHKLRLNSMDENQTNILNILEKVKLDFDNFKNSQELKMKSIQEGYVKSLDILRKEFQSSFLKLQKDLVVSPTDVYEQNNNLVRKLESASLDGTNAMLKVNNMDMTMRIIEKKIENLSILIKKIELQAQG